ncbi:hypothetical protein ACFQY7_36800 [Actinomadura luteofluorescens]|uniref:hypothetical protein n=1 Tax=Actinomadura luteofluorescens TaxID=46163 RepID=UPI00362AE7ED
MMTLRTYGRAGCLASAALALAVSMNTAGGAVASVQPLDEAGGGKSGKALQAVLDEAVRQGAPGALAQSRTPHRVLNLSSGVADLTTRRPPRAYMKFRAAASPRSSWRRWSCNSSPSGGCAWVTPSTR